MGRNHTSAGVVLAFDDFLGVRGSSRRGSWKASEGREWKVGVLVQRVEESLRTHQRKKEISEHA